MKKHETNLLERINPTRNAVIIDFFESEDKKGEKFITRMVSIECKDKHLHEAMNDYALNIIRELDSKGEL